MKASPLPLPRRGDSVIVERLSVFIVLLLEVPASPLSLGEGGGVRPPLFYHLIEIQYKDTFGANLFETLNLVP